MADTPHQHTWLALQEKRLARGWTLAELAKRAGLSHPYVSQLESGSRNGRPGSVKKLADALDTTVADLTNHRRPA